MQASDVVPDACIFLVGNFAINNAVNGEGEMKRQHIQPEVQPASGDLSTLMSDQTSATSAPATGIADGRPQAPVGAVAPPEENTGWGDEEPIAHTGGVCLLIA